MASSGNRNVLIVKIMKALTREGQGRGLTEHEIVEYVRIKCGDTLRRNISMYVHKALRNAVDVGLLRCRYGRYSEFKPPSKKIDEDPSISKEKAKVSQKLVLCKHKKVMCKTCHGKAVENQPAKKASAQNTSYTPSVVTPPTQDSNDKSVRNKTPQLKEKRGISPSSSRSHNSNYRRRRVESRDSVTSSEEKLS